MSFLRGVNRCFCMKRYDLMYFLWQFSLTIIGILLLNVVIRNNLALASHVLGTSSFALLQITCMCSRFYNSLLRHLWSDFREPFLRDHANAQRGGPLYRQTRLRTKLEILSPCANAHYASANASACKISHSNAFLRASSQTLVMWNFAAIEFPILMGWCCRHKVVTVL
jgi:hypothetical protein